MDFRIKQLQCFLTLAELLNFGETARALATSQSNVTFQMQALEETLGAKLFERDRKQVTLTDAGYDFRGYAQSMVEMAATARASVSGRQTALKLRVGFGLEAPFLLLPIVLRALATHCPSLEVEFVELASGEQAGRLAEGGIDALLMVAAPTVSGVRFDAICAEPMVAVVASGGPLAALRELPVRELLLLPMIASRLEECPFHQPYLRELFAPYGYAPRFVEAPASFSAQFAYASAGKGVAVATASMAWSSFPGVRFVPFAEPLPPLELGLASLRSNTSEAMRAFRAVVLDCAEAVFAEQRATAVMRVSELRAVPALRSFPAERAIRPLAG